MKTAAEFYEIFRRHGFLVAAVHTPEYDHSTATPLDVRWSAPGEMAFDGVVTVNRAVTFPIDALPTLRSGDRMVIAGKTYSVRRALPRPDTDGSEWLAELVLLD